MNRAALAVLAAFSLTACVKVSPFEAGVAGMAAMGGSAIGLGGRAAAGSTGLGGIAGAHVGGSAAGTSGVAGAGGQPVPVRRRVPAHVLRGSDYLFPYSALLACGLLGACLLYIGRQRVT